MTMSGAAPLLPNDDLTRVHGKTPWTEPDGSLPLDPPDGEHPDQVDFEVPAPAADAIRQIINRYEMAAGEPLPPIIAVTSAIAAEGVTTLSKALASILSTDFDADVCWIDLSWPRETRRRSVAPVTPPGVSGALHGSRRLDEVLYTEPGQPRVSLVPCGAASAAERSRLLRSPQLAGLMAELLRTHDYVVIDAGAVLANSDALMSIRLADAYLLVVRHGATSVQQVQSVVGDLSTVPSIGVILNQYRTHTPRFIRSRLSR